MKKTSYPFLLLSPCQTHSRFCNYKSEQLKQTLRGVGKISIANVNVAGNFGDRVAY